VAVEWVHFHQRARLSEPDPKRIFSWCETSPLTRSRNTNASEWFSSLAPQNTLLSSYPILFENQICCYVLSFPSTSLAAEKALLSSRNLLSLKFAFGKSRLSTHPSPSTNILVDSAKW